MVEKNRFIYLYLLKRRRVLGVFINVVLSCIHPPRITNLWRHKRTTIWYDLVTVVFSDEQWYKNFQETKATFRFVLEEIPEQVR